MRNKLIHIGLLLLAFLCWYLSWALFSSWLYNRNFGDAPITSRNPQITYDDTQKGFFTCWRFIGMIDRVRFYCSFGEWYEQRLWFANGLIVGPIYFFTPSALSSHGHQPLMNYVIILSLLFFLGPYFWVPVIYFTILIVRRIYRRKVGKGSSKEKAPQ